MVKLLQIEGGRLFGCVCVFFHFECHWHCQVCGVLALFAVSDIAMLGHAASVSVLHT